MRGYRPPGKRPTACRCNGVRNTMRFEHMQAILAISPSRLYFFSLCLTETIISGI